MLPSYVSFSRAITSLRSFLAFQVALDGALRLGSRVSHFTNDHEQALGKLASAAATTTIKRYAHTLVVMELYGAIEQLIDGLIRDYLTRLTSVFKSVHDLPTQLIETHTRKSIELLRNAHRLPFPVSKRDVIRNLHHCFESPKYQLNFDAFTLRTANMRTSQIRTLFQEAGLESITRRAFDTKSYQHFLSSSSRPTSRRLEESEFPELDELVEYRNEAAHGTPSTVLTLRDLSAYVEFGEALGMALDESVQEYSIEVALSQETSTVGELIAIYGSRVVCLKLLSTLRLGDELAARTPEGRYRWSAIKRIEENGSSLSEAATGSVVGIEVGFTAKQNQQFFKLPW